MSSGNFSIFAGRLGRPSGAALKVRNQVAAAGRDCDLKFETLILKINDLMKGDIDNKRLSALILKTNGLAKYSALSSPVNQQPRA